MKKPVKIAIWCFVVGVVLVAGMALKKFMPGLFRQIGGLITGAANSIGRGGP